jgi:hypothetical protein
MFNVHVEGRSYRVTERPGYLKADMRGDAGWTAVYADSYTSMVSRIRRALRGQQS